MALTGPRPDSKLLSCALGGRLVASEKRNCGPARCPRCGERQNRCDGVFDLDREPFGPVVCMACGRPFSRDEFLAGLEERPAGQVVRFPGRS